MTMAEETRPAAQTAPGAPETNEIASIRRDFNLLFFGDIQFNTDPTLLTRGGGKGLKIYDELERDAHAYAVLHKRKMAVISRPWDILPASDSPIDVQAADVVRENFKQMQFDRICTELLDATLKGFAVGEVMWAIEGSSIVAQNVIPRDQRRFAFDLERRLRLLTRERMLEGEELPQRKFIVHSVGAKDGSPYGLGLGHRLFWPVFFKRQDIVFWLTFADKFGSPTSLGKYPPGTQPVDQEKLLNALQAISQDAGIIIPEGMAVELLEAARSGSIDTYEKLARYMDEQISEATLGETMSTTAQGAGLGSGQANVHNEVRVDLAKADGNLLSDALNDSIVKWIVDYNVPGAAYPKLYRDFDEDEDLTAHSERDKNIYELGYEPDENYITETYGPGWNKRAAPAPAPAPFGGPGPFPQDFAEGAGAQRTVNRETQQAFLDAADSLAGEWRKMMGKRVEDLQSMLDETGDLAMFRERMDELLDAQPSKELVEALARAGFAAHVVGRANEPKPAASFAEAATAALKRILGGLAGNRRAR